MLLFELISIVLDFFVSHYFGCQSEKEEKPNCIKLFREIETKVLSSPCLLVHKYLMRHTSKHTYSHSFGFQGVRVNQRLYFPLSATDFPLRNSYFSMLPAGGKQKVC